MLWYVALIAALNLGAGYYWGAHLRRCPRCALVRGAESLSISPPIERIMPSRAESGSQASEGVAIVDGMDAAAAFDAAGGILGDRNELPSTIDPLTGLVTREHAEQLLARLTTAAAGNAPATVALVEVNRIAWSDKEPHEAVDERLFRGVSTIVRQSLERQHTAACFADQQLLLLVPNEDVHQATRRAEELRQRVASTEFVADGQPFQTTVTCALAEVSSERSGPRLFEFLQEALGEAKRYGGNRTFMHDGNSPTPVVPSELTVAPQQLAI
jgi:diguanylate cyclase (GGDEF)-like protein